ncbi:hypothetical protein ACP70R_010422 [Stipagrostis hirtigluma subsp. patula]
MLFPLLLRALLLFSEGEKFPSLAQLEFDSQVGELRSAALLNCTLFNSSRPRARLDHHAVLGEADNQYADFEGHLQIY